MYARPAAARSPPCTTCTCCTCPAAAHCTHQQANGPAKERIGRAIENEEHHKISPPHCAHQIGRETRGYSWHVEAGSHLWPNTHRTSRPTHWQKNREATFASGIKTRSLISHHLRTRDLWFQPVHHQNFWPVAAQHECPRRADGWKRIEMRKMAIWAHSPHSPIRCLPPLLCTFLLTWWLTCALSRCFGRWRDRDRNLFLLKMVVNGPVNDRQLDAGCAFCARLS